MKFDYEKIFIKKDYPLYINIVIASILFILYKVGVSPEKLMPFLATWLLLFVITSIIGNRIRFDSIRRGIEEIKKESGCVVQLNSMKEAFAYLAYRLQFATSFKNTVFGELPERMAAGRKDYIQTCLARLNEEAFEMHEIVTGSEKNLAECRSKVAGSRGNYFFSILENSPMPLLPFSIVQTADSKEVIVGWYGEVHKPYQKDVYLVLKDPAVVGLYEDYFRKGFDFGKKDMPT